MDALINKKDISGKVESDTGHKYHVRKTYYIDKTKYDKINKYIKDNKSTNYNLVTYNCTTFAVKALAKAGIKKHKWQIPSEFDDKVDEEILDKVRNFKGYYPGAAGQQLQQ